jgi:hypothetical protein
MNQTAKPLPPRVAATYPGAPRYLLPLWLLAVESGVGEDRVEARGVVTYAGITPEDVRRFPELSTFPYLAMWEDDMGMVRYARHDSVPEEGA